MCGFAGYSLRYTKVNCKNLKRLEAGITHRGPDGTGYYISKDNDFGAVHTRLSIVDLSERGRQPMISGCGRFALVFNGEIYNYRELRSELSCNGVTWKTATDTEVLLQALLVFGVDEALKKVDGMFAFCLYDNHQKIAVIARDKFGEKPLYWMLSRELFLFASDLSAIRKAKLTSLTINHGSVSEFLQYGYVPEHSCIYEGVIKLRPGSYAQICLREFKIINESQYFQIYSSPELFANKRRISSNLQSRFEEIFRESVRHRLDADVEVGVLLSGGVDSSSVALAAQMEADYQLRTFTLGFESSKFDESIHAQEVASAIGSKHHTFLATKEELIAAVKLQQKIYTEPFADSSQVATSIISKYVAQQVKVALGGDGADELFCGYNRHIVGNKIWKKLRIIPTKIRNGARLIENKKINVDLIEKLPFVKNKIHDLTDKLNKTIPLLSSSDFISFYNRIVSDYPYSLIFNDNLYINPRLTDEDKITDDSYMMMIWDMLTYLPSDILVKVDRASMHYGLEVRSPLLSNELFNFSQSVDFSAIFMSNSKPFLRDFLYKNINRELIDRPKKGFGIPVASLLTRFIPDHVEDTFSSGEYIDEIDYKMAKHCWHKLKSGDVSYQNIVWKILMYYQWRIEHA